MHKRTIHKEQVARWEAAGCVAAAADDVSNTAEEPQLARGGGGLRGGLEHSFFLPIEEAQYDIIYLRLCIL